MKFSATHAIVFILSFFLGCALVYYSPIEHKTIFIYPTPSNTDTLQYKDASGTCFHFKPKSVTCTGSEEKIPIQAANESL